MNFSASLREHIPVLLINLLRFVDGLDSKINE